MSLTALLFLVVLIFISAANILAVRIVFEYDAVFYEDVLYILCLNIVLWSGVSVLCAVFEYNLRLPLCVSVEEQIMRKFIEFGARNNFTVTGDQNCFAGVGGGSQRVPLWSGGAGGAGGGSDRQAGGRGGWPSPHHGGAAGRGRGRAGHPLGNAACAAAQTREAWTRRGKTQLLLLSWR